jgi:tetratricopeptide (TPR) repeat protein
VLGHSKKVALLEAAFADAGKLYRQNASRWREQMEKTSLALAAAYTDWGIFEQDNTYSEKRYRQALQLLDTFGTFKNHEPQRLKAISINRLRLGNCMLDTDRLSEAARQFGLGLETTDRLLNGAPADSVAAYRNDHRAQHLTQLGMVRWLEGNAAEAKTTYEQAYDAMIYVPYPFFFGHVALLENNEPEALEQYKSIDREDLLGQAMFEINRLADRLPKRKPRLEAFASMLRDTILKQHPEMVPEVVDYWYAELQTAYTFANKRWENAIAWNEKSVAATVILSERPDIAYLWKTHRLNAALSRSYFLIFAGKNNPGAYEQAIICAQQGESYAAAEYDSYPYRDWFKTNIAHAGLLRNQPGDREKAIAVYREFLAKESYDFDRWEILQKDFRQLSANGLRLPDLKGVIEAIKPAGVQISARDWQEMGI